MLKVAATPQTIDGVLSTFLARFAKHRPNVQISLNEAFGAELLALLERGEAHVVITTGGAIEASHQQFDVTWLPPLEFVAVCNPSADIGSGQSMDVRELSSHPVLLLSRSFAVRGAFDAACRVAGFKPNVAFESATPHTLLALAEAGLGIAIVPSVLPTHRYNVRVTRLEYGGSRYARLMLSSAIRDGPSRGRQMSSAARFRRTCDRSFQFRGHRDLRANANEKASDPRETQTFTS